MTQVTNQPSYALKALPVPNEPWPRLSQVISRVAYIFTVTVLTASSGVVLALSGYSIAPISWMIRGGLIGLIAGIAGAVFMHFPSNAMQYRIEIIKKMKEVTTNPDALEALDALANFFEYPFTEFKLAHHPHLFYKLLIHIGDHIDPQRPDIRKFWEPFLKHLDKTKLQTPDKTPYILDTTLLQLRLEDRRVPVSMGALGDWFSSRDRDLDQIEALGQLSFGGAETFTKAQIAKTLAEHKPSRCVIARSGQSKEVLGYGWYYTENGIVHIPQIARRPEAAGLNIGHQILLDIIKSQKKGQPVQIIMRTDNPFIHTCMKKFGFKDVRKLGGYYGNVDAVLLELDWEKYK